MLYGLNQESFICQNLNKCIYFVSQTGVEDNTVPSQSLLWWLPMLVKQDQNVENLYIHMSSFYLQTVLFHIYV